MTKSLDIEQYLEQEIRAGDGFAGLALDEETVVLLEKKLAEQNMGIEIFYLLAIDQSGHAKWMIPRERVDARTFKTDAEAFADAFRDVGVGGLEAVGGGMEVELISISRVKQQNGALHVTRDSIPNSEPGGVPACFPKSNSIKKRKK